jgi:hypothetical protein
MEIYFLLAEAQRLTALAEGFDGQAQDVGVEGAGPFDIRDRENKVIEAFDDDHLREPLALTIRDA